MQVSLLNYFYIFHSVLVVTGIGAIDTMIGGLIIILYMIEIYNITISFIITFTQHVLAWRLSSGVSSLD